MYLKYVSLRYLSEISRWNFWSLSHTCHISKMRHGMGEANMSLEKIDMIEKVRYLKGEEPLWRLKNWRLANSGNIELCEKIRQLNFIYLCISYFLSINVQSYLISSRDETSMKNFCFKGKRIWSKYKRFDLKILSGYQFLLIT